MCKIIARVRLPITFFLCLFLIASCSDSPTEKNQQHKQNVLRVNSGPPPQSLDPHVATGNPESTVMAALSERLVRFNLDTYEIQPAGATSWKIAEDGLKYTFYLRENARWSNGDPVTAMDYVNSWNRALTPEVGWQYANDYYFLVGAEAFNRGELKDFNQVGVKALDDLTIEFSLKEPYPIFLRQLTSERKAPIHRASIEKIGDFFDVATPWAKAGNYISNGPFRLVEWELNKVIVLERNPYYWDVENVKLEQIHMYPSESEAAAERLFRAGQIDMTTDGYLSVEKIANYKEQFPKNIASVNGYGTYYYMFNVASPPFDDINVRRALTHAIDRDAIVKRVTKSGEQIATTYNPPVSSYSDLVSSLTYDLTAAKKYLADAGYPEGKNFPQVTLLYNTLELHRKLAVVIQQMWKKNLGIDVTLENQEWKVYLDTRKQLNYQVARAGIISDIGDPEDFLSSYTTGHGMNHTGWGNKDFDQLIKEATKTIDENKRFSILAQAETILLEELPIMPIYYYVYNYLIHERVKGVKFNSIKRFYFQDMYIDENL